MNRSSFKAGAIVAAVALTLGSVATPALARGGFQHGGGFHGGHMGGGQMGGGHMGGGHMGGGHMGGGHMGGGFNGGVVANNGGFQHGWSHNRGGWNQHRGYGGGGYYGGGYYDGGYGYGGLGLGLAAGVIGGALLASQSPYYDYGYSAEYPSYGVDSESSQAYCASRFKSFNPATGTYLGYDGLRHSCP